MSDFPKPDCAWEAAERRHRNRNRLILLLGLLIAALTAGVVRLHFNSMFQCFNSDIYF